MHIRCMHRFAFIAFIAICGLRFERHLLTLCGTALGVLNGVSCTIDLLSLIIACSSILK